MVMFQQKQNIKHHRSQYWTSKRLGINAFFVVAAVVTVFVLYIATLIATINNLNLFTEININVGIPGAPQPGAYMNKFPIFLRKSIDYFYSTVACTGGTPSENSAWKHRSCDYVHLCLDFSTRYNNNNETAVTDANVNNVPEFFIVASDFDEQFRQRIHNLYNSTESGSKTSKYHYSSTEIGDVRDGSLKPSPIDVALGGINPRWKGSARIRRHGYEKVKWKPKIYRKMPYQYHFELENDVVMIPFHSFAADNIGHLLWDDLLPVYNLLRIFGYDKNKFDNGSDSTDDNFRHLLIRVDTLSELYASCDLRPRKKTACKKNFERMLPLFGVDPETFSVLSEIELRTEENNGGRNKQFLSNSDKHDFHKKSTLSLISKYPVVCSKHAVAGIGLLTDHGIRDHGWMTNNEQHSLDVAIARNVGRGSELFSFRNFLLRNIGMEEYPVKKHLINEPHKTHSSSRKEGATRFRIILSAYSSNDPERNFGFEDQAKALKDAFPTTTVTTVIFSKMSIREQISYISNQNENDSQRSGSFEHVIFITACGGGAMTGFFLPKGSSIILYYPEKGGYDFSSKFNLTGGQAMLDWDLFNNLSYLRVHWLPIGSMNIPLGLDALLSLIRHEMLDITMNMLD